MNNQYTATVLEGKFKFNGGNRKIKATRVSLDGILAATKKFVASSVEQVVSFIDKLKEKQVELTRVGETGKCKATEGKAINVSSGMFNNEKANRDTINGDSNLREISLKMEEKEQIKEDNSINDDTNADSIIKALNIFETTNNLGTTDTEEKEEAPSFITQMTSEMDTKEEKTQPEVEKPVVVEPAHEASGYLNAINAFKSQVGTDKFAEENVVDNNTKSFREEPAREFKVHTNDNPMRFNMPEQRLTEVDSDINDFVKGYYNLEELSLAQIKNYKVGCDNYIRNAKAKKNEASQTINGINMQIEDKDAQIKELYKQINAIEAEKGALMTDKQTWQGIYSEANTEESLGSSKMEEIDNFIYQEFNSMSEGTNNYGYTSYSSSNYDGADSNGYGRGRAA